MFKAFQRKNEILLTNVLYHRAQKNENTGKWGNDSVSIIYRDMIDGKMKTERVESPTMKVYISKEEFTPSYKLSFIDRDKVDEYDVSYKNVTKDIADILGPKYVEYYFDKIKLGQYSETKNIHKAKRVFNSDMDIQDYVRFRYLVECGAPEHFKITKSFLDIEVDYTNLPVGQFPDEKIAPSPVNAITFINDETKDCYTFLLRNKNNPQIQELEDNLTEFLQEITNEFKEVMGVELNYKIAFFDDEIEMIVTLFNIINALKPNFCLGWNFAFDMLTLMGRLERAGIKPETVMCHPDFKDVAKAWWHKDEKAIEEKRRRDSSEISGYTVYLCQMITYASLRKNFAKTKGGYSLSNIGKLECGFDKLEYHQYANTLAQLPYKNYRIFVKYNIRDVVLQLLIDNKTHDLETVYQYSLNTCTRYAKIFNETIFLKNKFTYEYYLKGLVIGNNQNVDYSYGAFNEEEAEDEEKFSGALVGNPLLNTRNGAKLYGVKSNRVFDNIVDFDFASLYPSNIRAFNIDQNTMYFTIDIKDNERTLNYKKINPVDNPKLDINGEFLINYSTRKYVDTGERWLNLPSYSDISNLADMCIKKDSKMVEMEDVVGVMEDVKGE